MLLVLMLTADMYVFSQSFAINTDGSMANPSALLDVKSNNKGVLIPRLTDAEKYAIASPATGLVIFQSGPDSTGFYYYDGSKWKWLLSNANADSLLWKTIGNTGTADANNFIGTIDNVPFNIRVNNQKAGRIESNIVTANTFYGYQAGRTNTTGGYNTAMGFNTLYSNISGDWNTAIGGEALYNNNTGSFNNAIGYNTLYNNTTGSLNTAMGIEALYSNISGNANTANGFQALYSNISGIGNTAIGFSSLYSNTIGYNNMAYGYGALFSNTTGFNNTAGGYQALYTNSSGNNNTANGVYSLFHNTIGSGNNANGYQALYNNTTGSRNTANGNDALLSNINGTQNTAYGYQAGYSLTSGSNNVFIGYQAGYSETTGSNKLYIANNNSNQPLIYGNFTSGYLGLGTISPSAKLHVGGGTRFTVLDTGSIFLQSGNTIGSARDWKMAVTLPNGYLSFRDMGFDNLNNGMASDALVMQWGTGNVGIGSPVPSARLDVGADFKLGATGSINNALIKSTQNIDIGSIAANSELDVLVTVTNASTSNSAVFVSPVTDMEPGIIIAWARVSAAGTVKIRFRNTTGSSIDPVAIDFVIAVLQ